MNTTIPPLYKTLVAIALVAGPLIWLLFTPDGQRRADLVLMPLFGRPNVEASLAGLSSDLTEQDIRARMPQLDLRCSEAATPLGDRVCAARIGSLGRLPAEALVFFFSSGQLSAAKLVYRRDVQAELLASLRRHLGPGPATDPVPGGGTARVTSWSVSDGVLLINAGDLQPEEEPALLWLSSAAEQQRLDGLPQGDAPADTGPDTGPDIGPATAPAAGGG